MRKAVFVLFLTFPTLLFSQKHFGLFKLDSLLYYVGGGYSKSAFLELGLATPRRGISGKSKLIIAANYELHSKPFLVSMKSKVLLTNVAGPLGCGANLVFFGLFADDWGLALAPEIGVAGGRVRGFYNHNFFALHPSYNKAARNVVGLNFWLGKKKL